MRLRLRRYALKPFLKNKKSEHILNKCSHNILSGGADGSRTRVQK